MRTLWTLFRPSVRREAGFVFVLMVLVSLFEMLGVGVVLPVAMFLVDPRRIMATPAARYAESLFGVSTGPGFVAILALLLLVVIGAKALIVSYGYRRQFRFVYRLQKEFSDRLLTGYMAAPYSFHLTHTTALISSKMCAVRCPF
ncbi:MAG: hypothetical protein ACYDEV_09580 [Acidiferrobacter sp.]